MGASRAERWLWGLAAAVVGVVLLVSQSHRGPTARCPAGMTSLGGRCCYVGQTLERGHCARSPTHCPSNYQKTANACRPSHDPIHIPGGTLTLDSTDWQSEGVLPPFSGEIPEFWIDRTEVTQAQWRQCEQAGACQAPPAPAENGTLPAQIADPVQAERYCAYRGGTLPDWQQWSFAAGGPATRRFPWGQTGLVCRRAAYGLVRGPCAEGASGPEMVGSRPDGATPTGLLDMAGNVSEWVRTKEGHRAMGGSFRSELASELKVWSRELPAPGCRHVGVRCVYQRL